MALLYWAHMFAPPSATGWCQMLNLIGYVRRVQRAAECTRQYRFRVWILLLRHCFLYRQCIAKGNMYRAECTVDTQTTQCPCFCAAKKNYSSQTKGMNNPLPILESFLQMCRKSSAGSLNHQIFKRSSSYLINIFLRNAEIYFLACIEKNRCIYLGCKQR